MCVYVQMCNMCIYACGSRHLVNIKLAKTEYACVPKPSTHTHILHNMDPRVAHEVRQLLVEGGSGSMESLDEDANLETALTADLEKLTMQLDFDDSMVVEAPTSSDQAMEPKPAESSNQAQQETPKPAESSDQAPQQETPKPAESSDQAPQQEAPKPAESSDQSTGTLSATELEGKLRSLLKIVQQPASSASDVPTVGVGAVQQMLLRPNTLDFEALLKALPADVDAPATAPPASSTDSMPPPSFIPVKRETMPSKDIAKALSDAAMQGAEAHQAESMQATPAPTESESEAELAEQDPRETAQLYTHTQIYIYN